MHRDAGRCAASRIGGTANVRFGNVPPVRRSGRCRRLADGPDAALLGGLIDGLRTWLGSGVQWDAEPRRIGKRRSPRGRGRPTRRIGNGGWRPPRSCGGLLQKARRCVAWRGVFVYGAHRNGVEGVPGRPIDIGVGAQRLPCHGFGGGHRPVGGGGCGGVACAPAIQGRSRGGARCVCGTRCGPRGAVRRTARNRRRAGRGCGSVRGTGGLRRGPRGAAGRGAADGTAGPLARPLSGAAGRGLARDASALRERQSQGHRDRGCVPRGGPNSQGPASRD